MKYGPNARQIVTLRMSEMHRTQCVTHIVTLELYVQHPSVHPSSGRNAILLSAIENKFLNIAKIDEIQI